MPLPKLPFPLPRLALAIDAIAREREGRHRSTSAQLGESLYCATVGMRIRAKLELIEETQITTETARAHERDDVEMDEATLAQPQQKRQRTDIGTMCGGGGRVACCKKHGS